MKAVLLNCSLKKSGEESNTGALMGSLVREFNKNNVECILIRVADFFIPPGVKTDMGEGDEWPLIHEKILESEILVIGSPTWLGLHSSLAQRVLERMDAMISEKSKSGVPVAYNKVAGVVVTGNQDGAKQVIANIFYALSEIGFTIPSQAYTFWNKGPGPGESYLQSEEGHKWAIETGKLTAKNLFFLARALQKSPLK